MKNTKGITLVALVITIIILLILAGITISQLTGSGLFEKAKESREKTLISEYKEKIELVKLETGVKNNGKITVNNINDMFNEKINKEWVNNTELFNSIIKLTTNDGYVFFITESTTEYKGKGEVVLPEDITAEMIEFTPSDATWKEKDGTDIKNVKQALDYLFSN